MIPKRGKYITRKESLSRIGNEIGLRPFEVAALLNNFFDRAYKELKVGRKVNITGLGKITFNQKGVGRIRAKKNHQKARELAKERKYDSKRLFRGTLSGTAVSRLDNKVLLKNRKHSKKNNKEL